MNLAQLFVSAFGLSPNAGQLQFFTDFAAFLSRKEHEACFVLRGYAGTGKTSSLAAIVSALPQAGLQTVLLAPTGRAAKVLSAYTGQKAYTIHKKIYRRKSHFSSVMDFSLAPNLARNTVFIIDEASMIADSWDSQRGTSFLADILQFVFQLSPEGKPKNCFLLFVGDTAQLPPVESNESPALSSAYLRTNFGVTVSELELTEVLRQQRQSGILANATLLRKQLVQAANDTSLWPKFSTKAYSDIFRMSGQRFVEGLEYAYAKYGHENVLVICRSNKSANLFNAQIRFCLLYRDEELSGGDHVMVVRNNYFWLPEDSEAAFIANGDMAKVIRVRGEEEQYGFRFVELTIELIDYPDLGHITAKAFLDTLMLETPNLPYSESNKLYEALVEDYSHIENRKERLNAIKQDPYYNALQIKFAYAVTCHKAQGGQWDAVFVDQGFIRDDSIDADLQRWLYTAFTRAKHELFLVNFHKDFFDEQIDIDSF